MNQEERTKTLQAIQNIASTCAMIAWHKGFHDDENALLEHLLDTNASAALQDWTKSAILQAELARIASEVGEAVEAVRKPGKDQHLPQFDGVVVELADVIIRIMDTCGKRNWPIGEAILEKMTYNATRPHKHGKKS